LLIKYITAKIVSELGDGTYLLGGPTGVSARLIGGKTNHSLFKLPRYSNEFKPLTGATARNLENTFSKVKFVIIDEYSLIGCSTLRMIDLRCKQATGKIKTHVH